jgi:hypothetical protein
MFEFPFFNSINFDCCLLLLAPVKSKKLLQFTNFLFLALILHFQDLCHPESIKALEFFHPQSLASSACFSIIQPIHYEEDTFFPSIPINVSNVKNPHLYHSHHH